MDSPTLFQCDLRDPCALARTLTPISPTCQLYWGAKINYLVQPGGLAKKES